MQFDRLKRRDFMTLLGNVAVTWPLTARAQQSAKKPRIAVVTPSGDVSDPVWTAWSALFNELRRLGYIEGDNLIVERYSAGGQEERFGELAREVVRAGPDVIVSTAVALLLAFKRATPTIPIVGVMADPIFFGLATSVSRPEGNITGVSVDAGIELLTKQLQVVRETVPMATRVGYLASPKVWAPAAALGDIAGQAVFCFSGHHLRARSMRGNIGACCWRWHENMRAL
jgi:putative ABC transport system substrate-binding protein